MSDEQDWVLRPVLRGLCQYTELKNGSLSLEDIATMNEALDVAEENQYRLSKDNT